MMRWISIAELQANADPRYRLAAQNQHMQQCIAQAKLEQDERHHYERQAIEREKMEAGIEVAEIQGRAMVERERVAGENAISLATRTHALAMAAKSSAVFDEMLMSVVRQDEEWNRAYADVMRQLVLTEADAIKQERLRKLDQTNLVEKLCLESNLRMVEMAFAYEIQNLRVTYDKTCEIIFCLVERALGLGPQEANGEMVREWVREAMEQTGGY